MENSWTILELPDEVNCDYVMNQFLELKEKVVINISSTSNEQAVLFTADNLQAMLLAGIRKIYIETMEEKQYRLVMGQQLSSLLATAEEIEGQLYNRYVTDMFVPITGLLSRLQNLIVMLTGFALQKNHNFLGAKIGQLRQFQEELGTSVFYLEDNVCCLDNLHYQMVPCLKQIIGKI